MSSVSLSRRWGTRLQPLLGAVLIIFIWWFAHEVKLVDPVLLPSPGESLEAFWKGLTQGTLWGDFYKTIVRTFASFI
ncbi:MAG: ABC transporter permease, partial [Burkholderiales bacterium]